MRSCIRRRSRSVGFAFSVGVLALVLSQGCLPLSESGGFDAQVFAGSYVGTWQSETTGESGPAQIDIHIDLAKQTATLSLDFGGKYLGIDDPPAHEVSGKFDLTGAQLQGQDSLFGNYSVLVAVDGTMVGVFRDVDNGRVAVLTYTGIVSGTKLTASYDVVFADGRISKATAELIKQ